MTGESLLTRVDKVLAAGVPYVMLREKDLFEKDLILLAKKVSRVVKKRGARLIVSHSLKAACEAGAWGLQLGFDNFIKLRDMNELEKIKENFRLGVSIHSLEEALTVNQTGAHRLMAGHVFETDCKKGLSGRGPGFIESLVKKLKMPIWAVGGIKPSNINSVLTAGAQVICLKSAFSETKDPFMMAKTYLEAILDWPNPEENKNL
jgi:thiamine-phosphate pyrophosphorylase